MRHHVTADFLHLRDEFIAKRVDMGKAGFDFRKVPGREQRPQPVILFIQIAAQVLVHIVNSVVDPAEPGVVGFGGRIVDDRVDEGVGGFRFAVDFKTFGLIFLLTVGKA